MVDFGVLVHGGVGSSPDVNDGCEKACRRAFGMLEAGATSLDAVVEAAAVMESDGRFNAGAGSVLRLDGITREMDASVMDSKGNIGIVIAIRDMENPVRVARAVMATPHVALSGQGATLFAKRKGFALLGPVPESVKKRHWNTLTLLREGRFSQCYDAWHGSDPGSLWNFEGMSYSGLLESDTIGAVAIDRKGVFAVAGSTGGAPPMLLGRVGDTPMVGCGFYAGNACAIAATGLGEEIIRRMLAKSVYDLILSGEDLRTACGKGIAMFPKEVPVGLISMSRNGYAIVANRDMASFALVKEQ
jgi:L-asparaginase / beta-aspartyl-peptidase